MSKLQAKHDLLKEATQKGTVTQFQQYEPLWILATAVIAISFLQLTESFYLVFSLSCPPGPVSS